RRGGLTCSCSASHDKRAGALHHTRCSAPALFSHCPIPHVLIFCCHLAGNVAWVTSVCSVIAMGGRRTVVAQSRLVSPHGGRSRVREDMAGSYRRCAPAGPSGGSRGVTGSRAPDPSFLSQVGRLSCQGPWRERRQWSLS